jgi:hypothetical protein
MLSSIASFATGACGVMGATLALWLTFYPPATPEGKARFMAYAIIIGLVSLIGLVITTVCAIVEKRRSEAREADRDEFLTLQFESVSNEIRLAHPRNKDEELRRRAWALIRELNELTWDVFQENMIIQQFTNGPGPRFNDEQRKLHLERLNALSLAAWSGYANKYSDEVRAVAEAFKIQNGITDARVEFFLKSGVGDAWEIRELRQHLEKMANRLNIAGDG